MDEKPFPWPDRGGLGKRLVGGECRHREGGRRRPRDGGRLPRDERGRSDEPLRPRALVSQRQWMGEHLVARCEARHVLADRGNDPSCFNPKGQRRPTSDVPAADPDDLVPVPDPGCAYRDHDLVRGGRWWCGEFEQLHLAAECVDAGGLHP